MHAQWGDRHSTRWLEFKLQRWRESARPEAVRDYARMFLRVRLGDRVRGLDKPVLALACETMPSDSPRRRCGPA
jgi:hypothetical protein